MNEIRDQEYFIEKEKLIVLPARINQKNCSIHWERLKWNTDEEINKFQSEGTVRVCEKISFFRLFCCCCYLIRCLWNLETCYLGIDSISMNQYHILNRIYLYYMFVYACIINLPYKHKSNELYLSILCCFYRLIISIWIIFYWSFRCICLQQADKVIVFRLKMSASQY